jgi:hypothetical protein
MLGKGAWGAVVLSTVTLLGGFIGCVDLFHSTDFETACGADAHACSKEAGQDSGPQNFCKMSSAQARSLALHACAWVGACTAPFDQNDFGACMIDAILAYDCSANPNYPVALGPLHDYWQAVGAATTCEEVRNAILPGSGTEIVKCPEGFACTGPQRNVNVECHSGIGQPEACLVEGRVCNGPNGCIPPGTGDAGTSCKTSKCDGTVLHDCEEGVDMGYDCAYFGGQTCVEGATGPACTPSFTEGAGTSCHLPTKTVSCSGGAATSCPSGQRVSVDCTLLTGKSTCVAGTPKPSWDIAAQCQGNGGCTRGCNGDTLIGCGQNAKFEVSCSQQGLGACQEITLVDGSKSHACGRPATP